MIDWRIVCGGLAAGAALQAGVAVAAPVELTFEREALNLMLEGDAVFPTLRGTFGDTGFTAFGQVQEPPSGFRDEDVYLLDFVGQPTGLDDGVRTLTLQRTDGRPFELLAFDIGQFTSGIVASILAEVTRGPRAGEFISEGIRLVGDFVQVVGGRAEGGQVLQSFLPGDQVLGDEFSRLTSVTFVPTFAEEDDLCRPENLSRIDPLFAESSLCADVAPEDDPLSIVDLLIDQNDNNAAEFFIDSITVETPAAIPTPGALVLTVSGLLALGGASRGALGRQAGRAA